MPRRPPGWNCARVAGGVKCGHRNLPRARKCAACGKARPVKKQVAHRAVLKVPYGRWLAAAGMTDGSEVCMICGTSPKPGKRLQRDHDHRLATARGLLCFPCNTRLPVGATLEWVTAAKAYLERDALDL